MTRTFLPARALVTVVSALLLVAAFGCGRSPNAPLNPGSGEIYAPAAGPQVLRVGADGSASWVTIPPALQSSTPGPGYEYALYDPTRTLTVTQRIDGAVGGRLLCGRYVLTVPPGAFVGVGAITMTLPDSTLMLCDLEVTPAELNDFLLPVDLSLHTMGTTTDLDSLEIYWWDPAGSKWTAMSCEKSTSLDRVLPGELLSIGTVEGAALRLSHFSRYAAGKAGW